MGRKIKILSLFVLGIFASLCTVIGSMHDASARTVTQIQSSIMDKAVYEGGVAGLSAVDYIRNMKKTAPR